jgi:hypothetical protein
LPVSQIEKIRTPVEKSQSTIIIRGTVSIFDYDVILSHGAAPWAVIVARDALPHQHLASFHKGYGSRAADRRQAEVS